MNRARSPASLIPTTSWSWLLTYSPNVETIRSHYLCTSGRWVFAIRDDFDEIHNAEDEIVDGWETCSICVMQKEG